MLESIIILKLKIDKVMLKKKIEDICNRQIEREGYSSNLYLAMAVWAETNGFKRSCRLDVCSGRRRAASYAEVC